MKIADWLPILGGVDQLVRLLPADCRVKIEFSAKSPDGFPRDELAILIHFPDSQSPSAKGEGAPQHE